MFHLAAYSAAIGQTANADIAALTDEVLTISNGHFRLVDNMALVAAAAMSATIVSARLDSPTIRLPGNPYILPVNVGINPLDTPRLQDLTGTPYMLPVREEIALQATSALACGTEQLTGLIWVSPGYVPTPTGRVQYVQLTSTTAAVANKWTNIPVVFQSSLPSGYWSVVGMYAVGAAGCAYRAIFPGQVWRPGCLGRVLTGALDTTLNVNMSLGEYGRFVNDNPPQFQVLSTGTTAVHTIYLGLVQVASMGPGLAA